MARAFSMKKRTKSKAPVSTKKATLIVDGRKFDLPLIDGTEGQTGIDISTLRAQSGCLTFDNGFANTYPPQVRRS
jgi:citrate synthase